MTDIMSVHVFAESATPATAKQINEQVQNSESTVYVFYSHPSVYVAHGLEQGRGGTELCDEWLDGITEAFEAQRKNRRKMRLICLQDALEHAQTLFEQTGLEYNDLTDFNLTPDHLVLMAAHQLILQKENISRTIERLVAYTMHLSQQVYQINVDAEKILKETNDAVARASGTRNDNESSTSSVLDEVKEENRLLTLQLQQVQSQLESYFIKYQDSEKQRAQEQLKNKQNTQVDKNDNLLAEKEAEIARLNKQLIKLELKSLNEELSSTHKTLEDNERATKLGTSLAGKNDKIVAPKVSVNVSQPAKQSLLSRIKKRLKLGQRKESEKNALIKEQAAQLKQTDYFDSDWYVQQYPDLKEAGVNPVEHYLRFGGFESRDPSPKFNSAFYLEQNPDVAQEGINPLLHFVLYGEAEGRLPKPKPKSSSTSGASE
jgi:hypothetical protein